MYFLLLLFKMVLSCAYPVV